MKQRFAKTYLLASYFSFKSANPLSYLGFLAFVCFVLLGLTGILLQVYYLPDSTAGYESVMKINSAVPYGFEIRNLHYWLANFMIILVVSHFFYLYFARNYRLKNEMLWLTGIVGGVLTILAAYTGYVLIMNQRAMLAIEIGMGILKSVDASLPSLLAGSSLTDTIVRMYTLHVVIIPAIIVILFLVHFPRKLVVDAPAILGMVGSAFVIGGLFPADLGSRFMQSYVYYTGQLIVPEWYLTGIYAVLRTGIQVFTATVLLPLTFLLAFVLIAFCDRSSHLGMKARAAHTAIGVTAMVHVAFITVWGFRARNFLDPIKWIADLPIDPWLFFGSLTLSAALIFAAAALVFTAARLISRKKWRPKLSLTMKREVGHRLSTVVTLSSMCLVLLLQLALFTEALPLEFLDSSALSMMKGGLSILCFAAVTHLYRRSF
jgi:ubiquinol-cytochrome c reductase cytochrome b subunit